MHVNDEFLWSSCTDADTHTCTHSVVNAAVMGEATPVLHKSSGSSMPLSPIQGQIRVSVRMCAYE